MAVRKLMIVTPEFGVDADGTYRPSGIAQVARCILRGVASSPQLERIKAVSLLDSNAALSSTLGNHLGHQRAAVEMFGCNGNKVLFSAQVARSSLRNDMVLFLHIGLSRLAPLLLRRSYGVWMYGIEVRRPLTKLELWAFQRATSLFSISEFTASEMRRYNPTVPKPSVVHLCVEPDHAWSDAAPSEGAGFDAATRGPAILTVGRMASSERYKGHEQLIDAWPLVLSRCPNAELWIAGDGDDRLRLETRARQLPNGCGARVHFLGRVSHSELLSRYASSMAFAMPSLGEGFGLVFVEAMRYGLPCIASHDAAAEVVVDGETGFVVDQEPHAIGNACVRLLSDDALANRMGRAGHERFLARYQYSQFRERLLQALKLQT